MVAWEVSKNVCFHAWQQDALLGQRKKIDKDLKGGKSKEIPKGKDQERERGHFCDTLFEWTSRSLDTPHMGVIDSFEAENITSLHYWWQPCFWKQCGKTTNPTFHAFLLQVFCTLEWGRASYPSLPLLEAPLPLQRIFNNFSPPLSVWACFISLGLNLTGPGVIAMTALMKGAEA